MSTSTLVLTGIAALSFGLLAVSIYLLVDEMLQRSSMRSHVDEVHLMILRALTLEGGPDRLDVARLAADGEDAMSKLYGNEENIRRGFESVKEVNVRLQTWIRESNVQAAHAKVLDLSVDQLVFADTRRESDFFDVIRLFDVGERLDSMIGETRRRWPGLM